MSLVGLNSLAALVFLLVLGCGKSLPDAYGVYANTNHGQLVLAGQPIRSVGNLMSSYFGVAGPSGPECSSVKEFIVYKKDIDPNSLRVVRLQFLRDGAVAGIFGLGQSNVSINLWVPNRDHVDVEVKPVQGKQDMYLVKPRSPLEKGFYALTTGQFQGDIGSEVRVYDLVIGSVNDFPSYASALATLQDEVKKNGPQLLDKLNQLLNQGDYQHLGDVYRPDGRMLSGVELQTFVAGNQTWLSTAGKVLKSDLITVAPIDENSARCTVRTTYEKAGAQDESVTVRKIGGQYFVTEVK
jgi:hypothetical protein